MAFRVAISGLKAASGDLDVISHNVANSNTTGFKKSRAEFADVFAVTDLGSSSSTPGSGVRLANVAQQFTQGNVSFTDNNLDLAISGRGFFIVNGGGGNEYTRAGAFGVDRNGFFSNSSGQQLIAFGADASGNITGSPPADQHRQYPAPGVCQHDARSEPGCLYNSAPGRCIRPEQPEQFYPHDLNHDL